MNKIARFEKVSYEQFKKDVKTFIGERSEKEIKEIYDGIQLPKRSTKGSAGYDFYSPFDITIHPDKVVTFPTGIRCEIEDGWVLQIYPRSGIGFKTGIRLANTVGIIDSDYYHADNEGHIIAKLVCPSKMFSQCPYAILSGDRIFQGVFTPYGITVDDDIDAVRYGGLGSTGA